MSVCWPAAIAAQPPACAGVGASKALSNHARTAGENGARESSAGLASSGRRAEVGVSVGAVTEPAILPLRTAPADRLEGLASDLDGVAVGRLLPGAVGQARVGRVVEGGRQLGARGELGLARPACPPLFRDRSWSLAVGPREPR